LASSTLFWWDPINNWAIGLVYNPISGTFPELAVAQHISGHRAADLVHLRALRAAPFFLASPALRACNDAAGHKPSCGATR
jgi:hypothetical protein